MQASKPIWNTVNAPQQLAKLTRPRTAGLVERQRLFERLDELAESPVVWVAAPPGAGKTSLIASYLNARKRRTLWYQVDEGDADLSSFFYYLSLAVSQATPNRAPFTLLLTPEYLPNLGFFTRRYFREMFQRLPRKSALVIDNFQEAETAQIVSVLDTLCAETPNETNVFVISRSLAPAILARHVANRKIASLPADDLKTRLAETRAMLPESIDESTLRNVHDRTNGWAAGIVLMREHMRSSGGQLPNVVERAPKTIFDYFAGETLSRLDTETRDFLLSTSLLPSMTAEMAMKMSGQREAVARLENLHNNHVFTERRDGIAVLYEYHPLFRDFLCAQLARIKGDQLRPLYERGASLLEAAGMAEQAAQLYAQAQAWEPLIRLTLRHSQNLLAQGRWQTLQRWIAHVPVAARHAVPWLTFWLGMSNMQTNQVEAIGLFEGTFHEFAEADHEVGQIACSCSAIMTYFVQMNSFHGMSPWIDRLDKLIDSPPAQSDAVTRLKANAALVLGATLVKPNHAKLAASLDRAILEIDNADIDVSDRILAALMLTIYCTASADSKTGKIVFARLIQWLEVEGVSPLLRCLCMNFSGYYLFRQGEDSAAMQLVTQGIELAEREGLTLSAFQGHFFAMYCHTAHGRLAAMESSMRSMHSCVDLSREMLKTQYLFGSGELAFARGNLTDAIRTFESAKQSALASGFQFFPLVTDAMLAVCYIKLERYAEAESQLEKAEVASANNVYRVYQPMLGMIRAWCEQRQGRVESAKQLLSQTLPLIDQYGNGCLSRCPTYALGESFVIALESSQTSDMALAVIRSLRILPPAVPTARWSWPIKIYVLDRISIELDDAAVKFGRKTPRKDLAVLKLLVAAGGNGILDVNLKDEVWPDAEGDRATNNLKQCLHRLRGLLESHDSIQIKDGVVCLHRRKVWSDVWAFEHFCGEELALNGDAGAWQRRAQQLLELYRGNFSADPVESPRLVSARERLRGMFVEQVGSIGRGLLATEAYEEARQLFATALDVDRHTEAFYQGLMRCELRLERFAEGLAVYERLRSVLLTQWKTEPSSASKALAERLQASKSFVGLPSAAQSMKEPNQ